MEAKRQQQEEMERVREELQSEEQEEAHRQKEIVSIFALLSHMLDIHASYQTIVLLMVWPKNMKMRPS